MMGSPDPYDAIATAAPQPPADPYAAVATAAPPTTPGAVYFGDTNQLAPAPQAATYKALTAAHQIDPTKAYGDPGNPIFYRPGTSLPPGSTYVDVDGQVRTALAQPPAHGLTADVDPRTAAAPDPRANPITAAWAQPDRAAPGGFGGMAAQGIGAQPQVNPVADALQTIPGALVHGTEALIATPADAAEGLTAGGKAAYYWTREHLPPWLGGMTPAQALNEQYGPQARAEKADEDRLLGRPSGLPDSRDLASLEASILGPNEELYQPKTLAGRFVNSVGELLPSTAAGGESTLQRVLPAVVGGLGGQGAAEVTRGTAFEPWARLGGTLVGAGGVGALTQPATVGKMLAQGLRADGRDVAGDIAGAQGLMHSADAMGAPISSSEAINQATGGAYPGLVRLQRVAEGTREGQAVYGPRMAARPQQLAEAMRSTVLDPLSPPTSAPSAIGIDAQQGSQAVLDTARQAVNAQAKPFYDAIGGEVVQPGGAAYSHAPQYSGQPGQFIPDEQFGPLAAHPAYQEALAQVRGDRLLNAGVENLPDNDLAVVDRVVKQLDRNQQAYAQTAANPGGNNFKAAQASNARSQADELAAALSGDWRTARDIVAGGHEVLLDPLDVGPIGQMARTNDVGAQTSALYPKNPLEGAAGETVQALRALGRVNDGEFSAIPAELTRQHLANTWNQASRAAVPNQWTGANWYKATLGNPEQKAVTLAGAGEAGGPELADALSRFADVAQATGWRARQGSSTAFNMEDLADMAHGGPVGTVIKAGADPLKIPEMARDAFLRWQVGRNSEALARSFIDGTPDERAALLTEALRNHPTTAAGWASKLLLYDNPVIPGREPKKEAASVP